MLKTDGYAVSVILSKAKAVPAGGAAPHHDVNLDDKRVVGVDPGRNTLDNCAWLDESNKPAFSRYSNRKCQQKIGLKKALAKRRLWMSGAGLHEELTEQPSAKTPSTLMMESHLSELFRIHDRVGSQRASMCARPAFLSALFAAESHARHLRAHHHGPSRRQTLGGGRLWRWHVQQLLSRSLPGASEGSETGAETALSRTIRRQRGLHEPAV